VAAKRHIELAQDCASFLHFYDLILRNFLVARLPVDVLAGIVTF
jgi:hypothetical protein